MARFPTSADAFTAIAERRRREILGALASVDGRPGGGLDGSAEHDVSWLIEKLGWPQAQVSKHLSVLREVGLVSVVRKGRRRMYSVNGQELRTVYDWIKAYERFWQQQLRRIKDRAERIERESTPKECHPSPPRQGPT